MNKIKTFNEYNEFKDLSNLNIDKLRPQKVEVKAAEPFKADDIDGITTVGTRVELTKEED